LNGQRIEKVREAISILGERILSCDLCPKNCRVNRFMTAGFCRQFSDPRVSAIVLHFGEEPPLVKKGGAGAVFFSGCTMSCIYCQNFAFSQKNNGREISVERLGEAFLSVEREGAVCLDLVTPTPNLYGFLRAYEYALVKGFSLPIVFNTSGYERPDTLKLLEGIVDVYLADIRYTDDKIGKKYSDVADYWSVTRKAIREMFYQVGSFKDEEMRGVIIRHLVLPENLAGTREMAEYVAFELSASVPISLMSQYRPVYRASEYPEISRRITQEEYNDALEIIDNYGLTGWMQHFDLEEPFRARPVGWDQ